MSEELHSLWLPSSPSIENGGSSVLYAAVSLDPLECISHENEFY